MAQTGRFYDSYNEYGSNQFQATDRFRIHASVFLPHGEVDPETGLLREGTRRAGRIQALQMEGDLLEKDYHQMNAALTARMQEKGIRMPLRYAILLIVLMLVAGGLTLLVKEGRIAQRVRRTASVNQQVEQLKEENTGYNQKIAEASDPATICYAAARDIGLVPANSTQAIHLSAMETRPTAPGTQLTAAAYTQETQTAGTATAP